MSNFLFISIVVQILIVSITSGFIHFSNIVLGQLTEQQQLEVDKLDKEIELLDQQIKSSRSDPSNMLYIQIVSIAGIIGATGLAGFIAWQREKKIPPTAEQEKIIQNIIKEWYSRNYLNVYKYIWREVENSKDYEKTVEEYWKELSSKEFPEAILKKCNFSEEQLRDQIKDYQKKMRLGNGVIKYFRKRGNGDEESIIRRIKAIQNSADVEYYRSVRVILPILVDVAVMATIHFDDKSIRKCLSGKVYDSMVESSLKKLKLLMIFDRIRENEQVCEILVRAKLNERIYKLSPTSVESDASDSEI